MSNRRKNDLMVRLSDEELARLNEIRPPALSRPAFIRSLLRKPPTGDECATRSEALSILTALAREGRVSAAIALERALREAEDDTIDPLDAILRK